MLQWYCTGAETRDGTSGSGMAYPDNLGGGDGVRWRERFTLGYVLEEGLPIICSRLLDLRFTVVLCRSSEQRSPRVSVIQVEKEGP